MTWLVKIRRYDGGDSVFQRVATKSYADTIAEVWNKNYQTDTYYVEAFKPEKMEWPDALHG